MKKILLLLSLCLVTVVSHAQDDALYLMPSFGQGLVFFNGQSAPVPGNLNICALDNTLRFIGDDGNELVANDNASVARVVIEGVTFLRYKDAYYRLYPVTLESGYAILRQVKLERPGNQDSYGTLTETSSSRAYRSISSDGVSYDLEQARQFPHTVTEILFLYKGKSILPFNKKNLGSCFPSQKASIEAYFKEGHRVPDTLEEAQAMFKVLQ